MNTLMLAMPVLLIAGTAQAVPTYQSTTMTCQQLKATVQDHGAVILKHPSRFLGIEVWETYVSGRHKCRPREITYTSSVPSLDEKFCRLQMCRADRTLKERSRERDRDQDPDPQ